MSLEFPEEDWLRLHQIRPHAIERFCKRALDGIAEISKMPHLSKHDAYLKITDLIRQQDADLARTFENPQRSRAIEQIRLMESFGILTPEELSRFTPKTRIRLRLESE